MEDPTFTTVTALEPLGKHELVDPEEKRLRRRLQLALARLLSAFVATAVAIDVAFMHPNPWFIVQSVLLFGYTVTKGLRFDRRARDLDDYRIARIAQGILGPKGTPKELL